jgi:glucose 1-dehydrogenase
MAKHSKGKTALVTGASRGIGRGIAVSLAREGYDIAFSYYSAQAEAEELRGELERMGVRAEYFRAALHETGAPRELCRRAIDAMGGIDVMVCNAGVTRFDSIFDLSEEKIDQLYSLNYRAYLMCARYAAEDMRSRSAPGRIIFIASTRGIRAYPEDAVYGSLKAALIRSVKSLALELADWGISVNAVAPGATKVRGDLSDSGLTDGHLAGLVPLGRMGSPRDIGAAVAFLVSPDASYITGETLRVDGGLILPGRDESPPSTE